MRSATVEEERSKFDKKLRQARANWTEELRDAQGRTARVQEIADNLTKERDDALDRLRALRQGKLRRIEDMIRGTNIVVRRIDLLATIAVFAFAGLLISNWFFGWLKTVPRVSLVIGAVIAAFGAYHQLMNALERPKVGVPTIMNWIARKITARNIKTSGLGDDLNVDKLQFERGRVACTNAALSPDLRAEISLRDSITGAT